MPVILKKPTLHTNAAGVVAQAPVASGTPSFIMTGVQAQKALAEEKARADIAREQSMRPFRFWISDKNLGKDYVITFLDGNLTKDGVIDSRVWSEHMIQVSGSWENIVCLAPEYCPVCTKADNTPRLVIAFTVVDHTPYTIQNGEKKGQVIQNTRKLYVVKRTTLAQLQKVAEKHDGLRGLQIEVSRTTAKAANVGDMFTPIQKYSDAELQETFGKDEKGNRLDLPFDYNKVAPRYTPQQLADMGLGSASAVIGNEPKEDLSSHL